MGTKRSRRRGGDGGMEENTMAILDTCCFSKSTQDVADDRFSFLEAVRSGFLVPDNADAAPTKLVTIINESERYQVEFMLGADNSSPEKGFTCFEYVWR
ncbi:negative regulator of systemic acquired resistance SNI1 isoform X1 [Tanacetum coccineum]